MRLVAILFALPLVACGGVSLGKEGTAVPATGSGNARSFSATGFTQVELAGADNVDVKIGPSFDVRAEGDPRVLDKLEIRKDGEVLRIGRKDRHSWNWSDDRSVRVHIVMPRLVGATVAGSGDMDIERAEGDFKGTIAGSGNMRVAQINGGKAGLTVAGSGNIRAAGTASTLHASIAGSGDIDASALKVQSADISTAGSGNTLATVSGQADVSIVGSGDVTVRGGAKCAVSAMGSGTADCG